jgi:diguanylate cyclase (GGDEF)-like protein
MKIQYRIYISLILGLLLLISALFISYSNINDTSKMLKLLDRNQIKINFYANRLNYAIKDDQAKLLQTILLKHILSKNITKALAQPMQIDKAIDNEIYHSINKLNKYAKTNTDLSIEFLKTIHTIKNRLKAYKMVRDSLIDAIRAKDTIDTEDALYGFNNITNKFAQETLILIELANANIYQKICNLKKINQESSYMLIFSFILSIILILIATYKLHSLQNNIQTQLQRALVAEDELKDAQTKLLSYNQNLEIEVNKISSELHNKIYTNPISGLQNRNKLLEDIKSYNFMYIALLNIDKFQSFNDVYGEETGNVAIRLTGEFLKNAIKNLSQLIYHIGGDEFAIVCIQDINTDKKIFIQTIENIIEDYKNYIFSYEDKTFKFSMSAGIATANDKKTLAYADMALKDAKKRNIQLAFFDKNKNLERKHKGDMECRKKIEFALKYNGILSYFQPIVPIQDRSKPTKYESLVRLKDQAGKIIPPFNFLGVAKTHRLYDQISYQVIKNTLSVIQKYQIPASLNISLADMINVKTMKYLFETLDNFESNHLLTIELLETEDFQNYDDVENFCAKIKSYGIKIALDDFGSGYSNFSHALRLPIDYIKIDATLISKVDKDEHSKIMVETIVDLAKRLGVETIAEFVASQEILDTVTALGVDYAQGYHLGKPLSIEEQLGS